MTTNKIRKLNIVSLKVGLKLKKNVKKNLENGKIHNKTNCKLSRHCSNIYSKKRKIEPKKNGFLLHFTTILKPITIQVGAITFQVEFCVGVWESKNEYIHSQMEQRTEHWIFALIFSA